MLKGGRGGEVRLKLFLTLHLIAARAPYNVDSTPARAWAELMALPDPEVRGARRIASALKWLDDNEFIVISRVSGAPPNVTLLSALGTGAPHTQRSDPRWINVPVAYWSQQWITSLSGAATALMLVLVHAQLNRTHTDAPWFTGERKAQLGLSADTWTRATKELVGADLLEVKRVPQGRDAFDWQRMRNIYWLDLERMARTSPASAGISP